MSVNHDDRGRSRRVAEAAPVQVYLAQGDRERLDRLTGQLDASKSDVLRRALEALERQLLDPGAHPALRVIGLAEESRGAPLGYDPAVEHDRFLADANEPRASGGRRRRGGRA